MRVDITSFAVSGAYNGAGEQVQEQACRGSAGQDCADRDHVWLFTRSQEDLKQWIVALATTDDGDALLFLQPLDGNSSDYEKIYNPSG